MAQNLLRQIRQAVAHLNPYEIRAAAERPVPCRIWASTREQFQEIADFLVPPSCSARRRQQSLGYVFWAAEEPERPVELEIVHRDFRGPAHAYLFNPGSPDELVQQVLADRASLGLALARSFPPFRSPVVEGIIQTVAKENALFVLISALPDIVPGVFQVPWAVAEFASDTVFLTVNQLRMLFLIAGASDWPVGYREQRAEIASVIAGAFGWRALARELVGKIPFGGGVVPKAAVAYAGTYVVGRTAERFYRLGYHLSRQERKQVYAEALEQGKRLARKLLEAIRGPERSTGEVPHA